MEIVSIDGRPAADAVEGRLPSELDREDPAARDWALRVLLAGRQNAGVHLEVRTGSRLRRVEFRPGLANRAEAPLTVAVLDDRIGYVRLNDSLGQVALVSAWDAALDDLRGTDGLILDLRDTPGAGNTTVARGLLGRLVSEEMSTSAMSFPTRSVATASGGSGWSTSRRVALASTTSPSRCWSPVDGEHGRGWRHRSRRHAAGDRVRFRHGGLGRRRSTAAVARAVDGPLGNVVFCSIERRIFAGGTDEMKAGRKPLERRIALRIARSKASVFLRGDFKDLGGYDQVGRSLRRLTAKAKLIRIGYGVYARAVLSPITGQVMPAKPLPALAAEVLSRLDVETVPSTFAQAYNARSSTQVPTGRVFTVKGRFSRKIGYGGKYAFFERVSRS